MLQFIINTTLLRELDEQKLISIYAKYCYTDEEDTSNDLKIKENLIQILDWDENGDNGLGIYCSHFESIKDKDWIKLINIIKENHHKIKSLAYYPSKNRKLESIKIVNNALEAKAKHYLERFTDENYEVSGRGKKARPCVYKGRKYKSRQECLYKEGITQNQLYRYLKKTGQV